jgi:hypothetical protein
VTAPLPTTRSSGVKPDTGSEKASVTAKGPSTGSAGAATRSTVGRSASMRTTTVSVLDPPRPSATTTSKTDRARGQRGRRRSDARSLPPVSCTGGPTVCTHANDSPSPSGSLLARASSVTTSPPATSWSTPASASGTPLTLTVTVSESALRASATSSRKTKVAGPVGAVNDATELVAPSTVTAGPAVWTHP